MDLVSRWVRVSLGIALCSLAGALGCGVASSSSSGNPNPGSNSLALGNASLNFGSVVIGSSATLSDTVTNNSSTAVTLASASASQSVFQLSSPALPLTLSPGQSANVVVAFAPQAAGSPSGNITLATSLASANQLQIGVTGKGVSAGSLAPSPQSLSFGNVAVGQSQSQKVTLSNPGGSSVTVSQASASSAAYTLSGLTLPLTLGAGQTSSFTVIFTPQATGAANGSISLTGSAALTSSTNGAKSTGQQTANANTTVTVSGDGVTPAAGSLVPNPASVNFGNVQVGSSKNVSETITNSGSTSITVSQAAATGTGFGMSGLSTPITLSAGQSVTFTLTFAPQAAGSPSGNVAITSTASNPTLNITLSGTAGASGTLSASPATLSFGTVTVGSTKNLTGSVTAAGSAVTISGASSNSSEFALSGLSFPLTLPAGQSASYTVTFAPQSSGAASGRLSFTSNATNGPNTEALSGTGQTGISHSVSLGWTASSSTVVGYNVYRGSTSGGPYSLVNSSDPNVTYSDATVQAGQTYFYVVTAVDSQGTESVYSNQAQATVPSP
jgi:hypothetical protein